MPFWLQHSVVFAIVGACAWAVLRQASQTLKTRAARFGSCCHRSCIPNPRRQATRTLFLPVEQLKRRPR